jgi:hypothetical protein
MPEKTAASIGERVGGAYADAGSARQGQQGSVGQPIATSPVLGTPWSIAPRSAGRELAQSVSDQFPEQRYIGLIAAFGLLPDPGLALLRIHGQQISESKWKFTKVGEDWFCDDPRGSLLSTRSALRPRQDGGPKAEGCYLRTCT